MRFLTLLFAVALLFASAASADDLSKADQAAIRAVIGEQLDAFKHDDAPRAFSLATAGIREQFGTPEVFLDMALYPMQRQSDGSWRIDGCRLARLQGLET